MRNSTRGSWNYFIVKSRWVYDPRQFTLNLGNGMVTKILLMTTKLGEGAAEVIRRTTVVFTNSDLNQCVMASSGRTLFDNGQCHTASSNSLEMIMLYWMLQHL